MIREDAGEHSKNARDEGTRIHTALELAARGDPYDQKYRPHVRAAFAEVARAMGTEKFQHRDWLPEKVVVHHLGYGGKLDLPHRLQPVLWDYKGKDFHKNTKLFLYDEHFMQIAAGLVALGHSLYDARGGIVYVSRDNPGLAKAIEIEQKDLVRGWEMFLALLAFRKAQSGHDPSWDPEEGI